MWEAFPYLAAQHACLPQKPWLAAPAALLQDSAPVYDSGDRAVTALVFMLMSVPMATPLQFLRQVIVRGSDLLSVGCSSEGTLCKLFAELDGKQNLLWMGG